MSVNKPQNLQEYERWLEKTAHYSRRAAEAYYDTLAPQLKRLFETSPFWQALTANMDNYQIEYSDKHGYPLFMNVKQPPQLVTKPFPSFLEKTFRENSRFSKNWEKAPREGWILPTKYDARMNDVVRTYFVVKYLDGAVFLRQKIEQLAQDSGIRCEFCNEARFDGGYYAIHIYVYPVIEAVAASAGNEKIERSIELQITTQLKEVTRQLLHRYYEERRMRLERPKDTWAWNYEGDEFSPNYVGHLLHYIEGLIMAIRNRGRSNNGS